MRRRALVGAFHAADIVVMAVAFTLAFVTSAQSSSLNTLAEFLSVRIKLSNLLFFAAFVVIWHLIFKSQGLYRSRRVGRGGGEWWQETKAVVLATLFLATFALLFDFSVISQTFLGTFFVIALTTTLAMRSTLRHALASARGTGRNLRNVVVVGCGARGADYGRKLRNRPALGYLFLGYIDDIAPPQNPLNGAPDKLLGSLAEVEHVLETLEVDEVFIALPVKSHYETIERIIATAEDLGLIVRLPANSFEMRLSEADVDYLDGTAMMTIQTPRPASAALAVKRSIDVIGSAIALMLLLPVLSVTALAIKLESAGPFLFLQERVGQGRRKFRMAKFRTMVTGGEIPTKDLEEMNEVHGAAFKVKKDPRLTQLGPFLRKYSVDELPQFWNVLKGDMSLVGPRPLPLRDVERFESQWQKRRFSVKPGLTCLWQANGRHEIDFEHWMELDLQYIDNWSLKLDFEIMLRTVPATLRGTGAS